MRFLCILLNERKHSGLYAWNSELYFDKIHFQGNLNGNFSVIELNALVAILTGSKSRKRKEN
jgi:hypothetical protein